jgi:geranylgeranyl diphosphate synthase, type II
MSKEINSDFDLELGRKRDLVDKLLQDVLTGQENIETRLKEAMDYTLHSPGKRIRAALVLWCCELITGKANRDAELAAAAIEMVHAYSLVHDDLPAMDNDDFRRGRPTCHKAFDEATAILTGDAILTVAFEILAEKVSSPQIAVKMISILAQAAGPAGMIAGQMADLKAENSAPDIQMLQYIHINKTAKMFKAAVLLGAIAGNANESQLQTLDDYGMKIGLGFQIADDILDVCSSTEKLGKTVGKDQKAGKMTYPALLGLEKSRQLEKQLADDAVNCLKSFGQSADILRKLALALLQRTK